MKIVMMSVFSKLRLIVLMLVKEKKRKKKE